MAEPLTIGEVAARSGVATSALRFYEERGLIRSERDGSSGHRRYARSVIRRVAFIVFAQRIGLTLDEVGEELSKLPENRVPSRAAPPAPAGARQRGRVGRPGGAAAIRPGGAPSGAGLPECIGCGCLSLG